MSRLAQHERIINRLGALEVRVQAPEGNNMATRQGTAQVAVTDSDGRVRAFCGPTSHPDTLHDAALFAAAGTLYEALTLAQMALEEHDDAELRADALRLIIVALGRCHPQDELN